MFTKKRKMKLWIIERLYNSSRAHGEGLKDMYSKMPPWVKGDCETYEKCIEELKKSKHIEAGRSWHFKITDKGVSRYLWKKRLVRVSIFFGVLFIGMVFNEVLGNPVHSFFCPPVLNFTVEQMDAPVVINGKYYARYFIVNNGDFPISGLFVDYSFKCANITERANLEKNSLNPRERLHFDFEFTDEMNYSCDYRPEYSIDFYGDEKGRIYLACSSVEREACMSCPVEVNVSVKEVEKEKTFEFWYPFSEANLSGIIDEKCVDDEQIRNLNLTKLPDRSILVSFVDFRTACIRGDFSVSWCKKYGFI